MKNIRVIIIDDEKLARDLIREYLAGRSEVEIVSECQNAREAYQAISRLRPDLIFLDIQMPEINGFELLEMLDEIPQVIFSTAYDQYAIKAFEVNAVDYLLKPYDSERFNLALGRAIKTIDTKHTAIEELLDQLRHQQKYLERLLIKESGRIVIITCREINWIRAMDDYVEIHTSKASYLIQQSMSVLESRLNPDQFIRAHRSYIVNVDAIQEIVSHSSSRYRLILKDKTEIFLSRAGAKKLNRFCI